MRNFIKEKTSQIRKKYTPIFEFIGLVVISFYNLFKKKTKIRKKEILGVLYESGPASLEIVCLISLLVGLILAYIGSLQLEQFGATLYIADLVSLAMLREMGAIMTSIIMAGRTGAAFAAQIATMETNEEIDALRTIGISPIDYLVTPRVISFILFFPLLCLFSNIVGIIGGAIVGIFSFDISFLSYFQETILRISISDLFLGLSKSVVFGIIVSMVSCFYGMNSRRTAEAVGKATTNSVVVSIVLIIVSDALFAILTNVLGI